MECEGIKNFFYKEVYIMSVILESKKGQEYKVEGGVVTVYVKSKGETHEVYLSEEDKCIVDKYRIGVYSNHEGKRRDLKYAYILNYNGKKWVHLYEVFKPPKKGYHRHHINYNGLDNRRENVEYLTPSEHMLKHK